MTARIIVALLVALAAMGQRDAIARDELPRRTFSCGDEVRSSARLAADVGTPADPCVEGGLRVIGAGVVLDLNRRTIWGNGVDNDPGIEPGVSLGSDVSVRNGVVRGFERGVFSLFNTATRVQNVVAADNDYGVAVSGSGHQVKGVVATRNKFNGISVFGDRGVLTGSVATHNGLRGLSVTGDRTRIRRNVSTSNATGLVMSGEDAVATANVVGANSGFGIHVDGGERPVLERNTAVGNGLDGIWLDSVTGGSLLRNRAIDNGNEGIQINGQDIDVVENRVSANVRDGIDAAGPRNKFKRNRADGNIGSGIEVDGTAQKLVGNEVRGNGASGIRFDSGGGTLTGNRMIANGFRAGVVDGLDGGFDGALATAGVSGDGNVTRSNDGVACVPNVCVERETDLPPANLGCGAIVSGSLRLAADVGSAASPCAGHGLVVLTPDTTIDLDGHTIHGNGNDDVPETEAGIRIHADADVRVIDGRIRGFEMGILSTGDAPRSTIDGNVISGSDGAGIQLDGARARIVNSAVVANGLTAAPNANAPGILVLHPPDTVAGNLSSGNVQGGIRGGSTGSAIERNVVMHNGNEGIFSGGLDDGGRFIANVVADNGKQGLDISVRRSTIKKNIVVRNSTAGTFAGIDSEGAKVNLVGNVTSNNAGLGNRIVGRGSVVRGNLSVSDASGVNSGIAIGTPAAGSEVANNTVLASAHNGILANGRVLLTGNKVYGNSEDGIEIGAPEVRSLKNRVVANGARGIHVVATGDRARVDRNAALANGFESANLIGLGIDASAADGVTGDNRAYGNDDPDDCDPGSLC